MSDTINSTTNAIKTNTASVGSSVSSVGSSVGSSVSSLRSAIGSKVSNLGKQTTYMVKDVLIGKPSNKMFRILGIAAVIVFIIVVFLIVYFVRSRHSHRSAYSRMYIVKSPVSGLGSDELGSEMFPQGNNAHEWTLSLFIYVKDWQYRYGVHKQVFSKGDADTASPSMYLAPTINDVVFSIYTDKERFQEYWVRDIDLRRWCHFGISMQNHKVDIYYKGRLVSSNVLAALPNLNNTNMTIGHDGGFSGMVANIHYNSNYSTPAQMYTLSQNTPPTHEDLFSNLLH